VIEDFYNDDFILKTQTTSTGWGSEPGWSTGAAYKGAINPTRGNERLSADKQYTFADYKLFCSSTVPITDKDLVAYAGTDYNVQFVKNTFAMDHHKLAFLKNNNV
jgi:hypothetical protein